MNDCVLMNGIQHEDGPFDDTVAEEVLVIMGRSVGLVHECRVGLHGVAVNTLGINPILFIRPEELNGVALTEIEGILCRNILFRTNDDMMVITAVAVPYDGIFRIGNTFPLAFPFSMERAAIVLVKLRINQISKHNRVHRDFLFADEGRVILCDFRNNTQINGNDGVTTAGRSVERVSPGAFFP